jgi:hypothetical protein
VEENVVEALSGEWCRCHKVIALWNTYLPKAQEAWRAFVDNDEQVYPEFPKVPLGFHPQLFRVIWELSVCPDAYYAGTFPQFESIPEEWYERAEKVRL